MSERYYLEGHFGERSASNNTAVCRDCGAVVYFLDKHDAFHDRLDANEDVLAHTPGAD